MYFLDLYLLSTEKKVLSSSGPWGKYLTETQALHSIQSVFCPPSQKLIRYICFFPSIQRIVWKKKKNHVWLLDTVERSHFFRLYCQLKGAFKHDNFVTEYTFLYNDNLGRVWPGYDESFFATESKDALLLELARFPQFLLWCESIVWDQEASNSEWWSKTTVEEASTRQLLVRPNPAAHIRSPSRTGRVSFNGHLREPSPVNLFCIKQRD